MHRKARKKTVIVMNYPKDIKAFYIDDDGKTLAAMDVLGTAANWVMYGT